MGGNVPTIDCVQKGTRAYNCYTTLRVDNQCTSYKGEMTEDCKRLLNSIGFVWVALSPRTVRKGATWDENASSTTVVAYKKESIHIWFHNATRKINNSAIGLASNVIGEKLIEKRKRRLDSTGFVWEFSRRTKSSTCQQEKESN